VSVCIFKQYKTDFQRSQYDPGLGCVIWLWMCEEEDLKNLLSSKQPLKLICLYSKQLGFDEPIFCKEKSYCHVPDQPNSKPSMYFLLLYLK